MISKFRLALLLVCLPLAACTLSPVPITAAKPQTPDERFTGEWRSEIAGQEASLFSITRAADGQLLGEVRDEGKSPSRPERLKLVTAEIAGNNYLSVTFVMEEKVPPQYLLLRYEPVSRQEIQIYIADPDLLADAVSRQQLSGGLVKDRHMDYFHLSSDASQLRDFIAAHGARVFHAKGPVLERVGAP
jgi:hypothetical protein